MIKHDAVAGAEIIALAIIHGCPIRKNLGYTIGAARPERCLLILWHLVGFPEHFAAGCLKKTGTQPRFADRFQDPDRTDASNIGCVFRNIEAHAHVALCAEMINFVRFQFVKELHEIDRIAEIAVMQEHSDVVHVRIGVEMIDARSVERAGAANDPVDFVAFLQQQISQITSVLASDAGDQRPFHWASIVGRFWETPTLEQGHGVRHRRYSGFSGGVTMIRARTARWASMSALMPLRPSASISSSCEPANVASSPYPWTSTKSPSSVATRLKSTVTILSSS